MTTFEPFNGGARTRTLALGLGVVGLIVTAALSFLNTRAALFGYLFGVTYWVGIAVAALIMVSIFHTAKAKWVTVVRKPIELMGLTVIPLLFLTIPLVVGMKHLLPWVDEAAHFTAEELHHLHKKHGYLNTPFFIVRQVIYFAVWIFVALKLYGLSKRQDADGGYDHIGAMRRWGPGVLPFLALTITFFAFDWLMGLSPLWQSTIYGAYYFSGAFMAAFALLNVLNWRATGPNAFGAAVTVHHQHNLGKFMLAFVAFWAYIAFSQFLLVWIANLPEEAPWYHKRIYGAWRPVSLALFFGHFVIPFLILLSRDVKLKARSMGLMGVYLLVMHALDMYWLIFPELAGEGPGHVSPIAYLSLVTSFVGVGGIVTWFALGQARGRYAVPVKDPYLAEALRYVQP